MTVIKQRYRILFKIIMIKRFINTRAILLSDSREFSFVTGKSGNDLYIHLLIWSLKTNLFLIRSNTKEEWIS